MTTITIKGPGRKGIKAKPKPATKEITPDKVTIKRKKKCNCGNSDCK